MLRITILFSVLAIMGSIFACGGMSSGGGATPTESYKLLYAAVKSKNTEEIKKHLTKKSVEFGAMAAQRNNTPLEKVYENGFTATTFSETLPTMRDERVSGDMGALEVWNSKESKWEDLAFIKEDGGWKLAIGDLFAGTYKSPGPGRDQIEKEAANAKTNSNLSTIPSVNMPALPANAPPPANKTNR